MSMKMYLSWRTKERKFDPLGAKHHFLLLFCPPVRLHLHKHKMGLLTKCEAKMAGYWPSSFFCMFMDRDKAEVHKLTKKERGQYPVIFTKQTWSIKDLLCGFQGNFSCGIQRVVPSGQDGSILPARVANHSTRFGSSCPLAELAI